MIGHAFKRIIRSWPLFIAVIAGVLISSTMFATVNIGSNEIVGDMVDEAIADVSTDMTVYLWGGDISTNSIENLVPKVAGVANVQYAEIQSRMENVSWGPTYLPESYEAFVGIENDSVTYDGITIDSGTTPLGANQTYLLTSPASTSEYEINDTISLTLGGGYGTNCTLELEIAGFFSATDKSLGILIGDSYYWEYASKRLLFIIDWTSTIKPVLDFFYDSQGWWPEFEVFISVYINRAAVISTVDIQGTISRLTTIEQQIANEVFIYGGYINNHLSLALYSLSFLSSALLFVFIFTALPIFFIAIYMGVTLSDVSFNLRRRETGLLLSKGFTRGTILRLYMTEGAIIGLLTGFGGILIALLIVPFFIRTGPWRPVSINSLGWDTIFWCIFFACFVAGISIYFAARKATKISTVEALREYSPATQSTGYRKTLAWAALILGGYKIFVWILGINVQEIVYSIPYPGFLAMIMLGIWLSIDQSLSPFAIILFIYGFSKIAVQGSTFIFRISEKAISKSMGDLGALATRSIQRNPTRTAAVVFMLALVLGYGVQTVAVLASEQDYIIRSIYTDVGADISGTISPSSNATALISKAESITGVESATVEFLTSFTLGYYETLSIRGIIAENWSQTAYYEENWFSFITADQALEDLANDNRSIIIQRGIAKTYNRALGDQITVTIGTNVVSLTIVGFFGPEVQSSYYGYSTRGFHSYVSYELLDEFDQINSSTANLLVNISPSANATSVSEALEEFSEISQATSAIEELEDYTVNPITNAQSNMMQMGLIFSFLLASLGTLIVITFTLKEKQRENALMAARGLSFRQTASVLIAESTTWVIFAVLIGVFTGAIATSGTLQNYTLMDPLLVRSPLVILSAQVLWQVFAMVTSLILCAVVPMLIAARYAQSAIEILR